MLKIHLILIVAILAIIFSCTEYQNQESPIETALASENQKIKRVVDAIDQHEIQIMYTRIKRENGNVQFTDYTYQVDSSQYSYPGSAVKFPIAILTLLKLNSFENIDRNTRFYVEGDTLETTFAREIEKIFASNDTEAYNRMFEFLGQDYINKKLNPISLASVRISHRLSSPNADEITTKPLVIYLNDSTTTILPGTINTTALPIQKKGIKKGIGFYEEDALINEPFNFSFKNLYPTATQHHLFKTIMFPEKYQPDKKINLTKDQLNFIHSNINAYTKKTSYTSEAYYNSYNKFLLFDDRSGNSTKLYNNTDHSYGTLTNCSYVKDNKNDIEFLVTATILTNKNGVFNDGTYEYNEIGFPFLTQLIDELHAYELNQYY